MRLKTEIFVSTERNTIFHFPNAALSVRRRERDAGCTVFKKTHSDDEPKQRECPSLMMLRLASAPVSFRWLCDDGATGGCTALPSVPCSRNGQCHTLATHISQRIRHAAVSASTSKTGNRKIAEKAAVVFEKANVDCRCTRPIARLATGTLVACLS